MNDDRRIKRFFTRITVARQQHQHQQQMKSLTKQTEKSEEEKKKDWAHITQKEKEQENIAKLPIVILIAWIFIDSRTVLTSCSFCGSFSSGVSISMYPLLVLFVFVLPEPLFNFYHLLMMKTNEKRHSTHWHQQTANWNERMNFTHKASYTHTQWKRMHRGKISSASNTNAVERYTFRFDRMASTRFVNLRVYLQQSIKEATLWHGEEER